MSDKPRFDDYTIDLALEADGSYVAEVVELPGCLASGQDPNEAVSMLHDSFALYAEDAEETGTPLPPAAREGPNGRVLLRLPRSLHLRVARAAKREGVSVNTFLTAAVAEKVGVVREREDAEGRDPR